MSLLAHDFEIPVGAFALKVPIGATVPDLFWEHALVCAAMQRGGFDVVAREQMERLQGWLQAPHPELAAPFPGDAPAAGHKLTAEVREGDEALTWYVVRSATRQEGKAEDGLVEAGFAVYVPRLTRWSRVSKERKRVVQPLFAGYLFAGLTVGQSLYALEAVHGVHGVVRISREVRAIDFTEVRKWLRLEKTGKFDKTRKRKDPEPGTPFAIASGPFGGHVGSFLRRRNDERVEMMLSMLGRETVLVLDEGEVDGLGEGGE